MFRMKTGRFILDHEVSFFLFKGNYTALLEGADINPRLMHLKMDMPQKGEDLALAAVRHFHNFLMSAATLIDHYRVAVGSEDFPRALLAEYKIKIAPFQNDVLAMTVKKLRNYSTHVSLPSMVVSAEYDAGSFQPYRLRLDARDLELWNGWNSAESTYLASLPDTVPVVDWLEGYYQKTEALYWWFIQRYVAYHPDEMSALDALMMKVPATHLEVGTSSD